MSFKVGDKIKVIRHDPSLTDRSLESRDYKKGMILDIYSIDKSGSNWIAFFRSRHFGLWFSEIALASPKQRPIP